VLVGAVAGEVHPEVVPGGLLQLLVVLGHGDIITRSSLESQVNPW
jgi:hypothetical protein